MIENIDPKKCTGCGICVDVCPLDTLRLDPFTKEIPPCRQACPAGVDVRGFIFYLKQEMWDEAARLIHQFLPYPSITGRLCTYPCEKSCVRRKVDDPLNIHALERHVGDYLLEYQLGRLPILHASKIAVIGSGPAGLAAAYFLRKTGYSVTIFEKEGEIGGSFLREVSEGRLKGEVLDAEIDSLKKMGVAFSIKTCLSKDLGFKELNDMRFKTIFLALGFASGTKESITLDNKETVVVDSVLFQTNIRGVFADADLLSKKMPLIKVVCSAINAANQVDRYLQGQHPLNDQKTKIKKITNIPCDGVKSKSRNEGQNGFDAQMAHDESLRCMSCGSRAYIAHPEDCMTCFECEVECPTSAIKVHPFKEVLPMTLAID